MNSIINAIAIWVLVRNISKLLIQHTERKKKPKKQPPPGVD